ncbi:MAG: hypothetical protein IT348_16965 [Candidatus Eisenbacteria bacterium]|nr:hypothetical protein [Candidatus Eisenbacteria bacterium]
MQHEGGPPDAGRVDPRISARMWEKLQHDSLRDVLLRASVFVTGFELLRHSVVLAPNAVAIGERDEVEPHHMKFTQFVDGRLVTTKEYLRHLEPFLEPGKRPDYYLAGGRWLASLGVISSDEVLELLELRKYRNRLAHELQRFLLDPDVDLDLRLHSRLTALYGRIERWRVRVDMSLYEEYAGVDLPDHEIASGTLLVLQLLEEALSSREERAGSSSPVTPRGDET